MKSVPIKYLRFDGPQDGPGLSVASSVTSMFEPGENGQRSRHKIYYDRHVRSFWVEYYDRPSPAKNIKLVDDGYIPMECVRSWHPVERVAPPAPSKPEGKTKTKSS